MANLPPTQIDYLDAPFPYFVCITPDIWEEVADTRWEGIDEDVVAFEIETGYMYARG